MKYSDTPRRRGRALATLSLVAAAGLVLAGCSTPGDEGDDAPFFSGKTLTLYVPYAPGGGTDLAARALAPLLQEYIEGNPRVIVENDPSTAGILGANEYAASEDHDGTTVLVSSTALHSAYLVDDPTLTADFNELRPLIGMATGSLVFVSGDTGITSPAGIAGTPDERLILGGQVPSGSDLRTLLALDLLGVEYQAIFGYEGSGDKRIAFERGEINIMLDNSISYIQQMQPMEADGDVVPIFSQGLLVGDTLERIKSLPELPTPTELYEEINGTPATGTAWEAYRTLIGSTDSLSKVMWMHASDPDEAYTALLSALEEIIADDAVFGPLGEEVFGGNDPLIGEVLDVTVDTMVNPDPAARDYLRDYLVERWDVSF